MSRRILVTGGAGYVGSHACLLLAEAGYEPVVYDNLSRGFLHAVQWGPFIEGDIRDTDRLTAAMREYAIDAVIHFAGVAYVAESVAKPWFYYENNVVGSLSLTAAMRAADVDKLIFSSTCSVFSTVDSKISEKTEPRPINPYGASKLMVERCLADYHAAYGLKWIALRYFNAGGADPQGRIGENHDPEPHLIPRLIDAALGRIASVPVLGTDYPTPDGTCIRDYVHVVDLARAHVLALRHLERSGAGGAYNLGTGQGYSVLEVAKAVERISGRPVPLAFSDRRPGDPVTLVALADRAAQELSWNPTISDIDTIVGTALAWRTRPR